MSSQDAGTAKLMAAYEECREKEMMQMELIIALNEQVLNPLEKARCILLKYLNTVTLR